MTAAAFARRFAFLAAALALTGSTPAAAPDQSPRLPSKVNFERHVMGLLGKAGCNTGGCHGSFQGKGGFRLSLFGYDPEMDYAALTRDNQGRRVNPADADNSLILLKATGQVDHGGLRRFGKDSWQYNLLRSWIVAGMPRDERAGVVKSVVVTPDEVAVKKAGEAVNLTVVATFEDGGREDITTLCDFRTNDENVATVSPMGLVETKQAGETAIIVSYRGSIIPVRVLSPMDPPPGFVYPKTVEVNYLDRHVNEKLRRLNMAPSELAGDAEFLRRVTIDTIGSLPTPEEIRAFLADKDPNKREKKIDQLLAHPLHAALWATKFCDVTGNNTDRLENPQQTKPKRSQMWHDWFRKRIAENVPYDEIVGGVLTATSRDGMDVQEWIKAEAKLQEQIEKGFETNYPERKTLDLFWRRQQQTPIEVWGEQAAVAFLGIRVECAQCHKHPFDRWTQEEYWAFANLFAGINVGVSPEARKAVTEANAELRKNAKQQNQAVQLREVYISDQARTKPDPGTGKTPTPRALGGPEIPLKKGEDPRVALFEWMRSPDNPFFAKSFANRVWAHYFGIGIVHPVDDFSLANPSSNDPLLDALAADFLAGKFDIRKLEKTVLMSRTYQASSTKNATNALDVRGYARSYVRPLMAEVVVDVINDAIGVPDNFGDDAPANARAIEVGSTRLVNQQLREAFRVFGRSPRTLSCDCERATEPTVANKLYLIADPGLNAKLTGQKTRARLLAAGKKSDAEIVEELFLGTLSRFPTETEKKRSLEYLGNASSKSDACSDILWALINTTEFIFNH